MMTSPLFPTADAMLNSTSSTSSSRKSEDDYDGMTSTPKTDMSQPETSSRPSSRIRNDDARSNQENISPAKSRHSRIMSGTELSPLRIVESQRSSLDGTLLKVSGGVRSPRKVSPDRRFPVKINLSGEAPSRAAHEQPASIDEVVQDNEGLKKAISIFEDGQQSIREEDDDEADGGRAGESSVATLGMGDVEAHHRGDAAAGDEDFMDVSAFSTFSAVPNMAMLAKLGQTSSAKRAHHTMEDDDSSNTSNLLMDFNERLGRSHRSSPARRDVLSPSRTTPNLASTATPSRQLTNLIDFEMTPMATPRSVPSITARELESLKSNFLSEISSLKASLSGKEAEVHSLKAAVGDAEKRVGESKERLREERALKEEMESVLRIVREEIIETQKEKEELEQQLDESEKRREASEMMHQEAESKLAGLRAGKDMERNSSPDKPVSNTREVEIAVERVARELHGLYKSKHETKVAALKKSYENRWEKKVRELEAKIQGLSMENEKLLAGHDATMTKADYAEMDEWKAQSVRDHAMIRELEADVQRLEAVISTVRMDNDDLRVNLQQERVEKGELVQLAEELMSMQSLVSATPAPQRQQSAPQPMPQAQPEPAPQRQPILGRSDSVSKTPRANAANRISGIRAPGTVIRAPHERGKSSIGGLPRPGGARGSGIMNSIEKMGNYRGRE
ncbi:central kinetochore-associated domain-containing protein [Trichoderma ceciliae]